MKIQNNKRIISFILAASFVVGTLGAGLRGPRQLGGTSCHSISPVAHDAWCQHDCTSMVKSFPTYCAMDSGSAPATPAPATPAPATPAPATPAPTPTPAPATPAPATPSPSPSPSTGGSGGSASSSSTGDASLDAIAAKYGGATGLEAILDLQASNGAGSCASGEHCTGFYTYAHLVEAIATWNSRSTDADKFLHSGDVETDARTLAAFLANVKYESAQFTACKERLTLSDGTCPAKGNTGGCSGGKVGDYTSALASGKGFTVTTCNGLTAPTNGCTDFWGNKLDGADCWFGRGALQVTWPGNYGLLAASVKTGTGVDICADPDAICRTGTTAFEVAIGYWHHNDAPWVRNPVFESALQVVRPADGSTNGLRKTQYEAYLAAMGISGPPPAPKKAPVPASCPQCSGGCWCTGGLCGSVGCSMASNCEAATRPGWLSDGSVAKCGSA